MPKVREVYVCTSCGAQSAQWKGQCPKCREWNTLELTRVAQASSAKQAGRLVSASSRIQPLSHVASHDHSAFGTGLEALDRILGRGFVPGAAILVGGEPGIGKSTLLLQTAAQLAASKAAGPVLYVSGEESAAQIRARADRLGLTDLVKGGGLDLLCTTHLADIEVGKGRVLKKGARIGYVGVSGNSFAPHLHYEVVRDSLILDPVNHFFATVGPEEYVNMLIMSSMTGQSMD